MMKKHSAAWKRALIAATVTLSLVFIVATEDVYSSKTEPITHKPLLATTSIPSPALAIIERSCQDCHSANTHWPWYANVPPLSWKIQGDVNRARAFMDLSRWDKYTDAQKIGFLAAIAAATQAHLMPPPAYLSMHRKARLSEADVRSLRAWAIAERTSISKSHGLANRKEGSSMSGEGH